MKTSRNSTAGLINAGTIKNIEQKMECLSFKVWGVYEKDNADQFGSYSTYVEQLQKAEMLGFRPWTSTRHTGMMFRPVPSRLMWRDKLGVIQTKGPIKWSFFIGKMGLFGYYL